MLAAQGKIEWLSTTEAHIEKPGSVPGVITHVLHGSLEEMVDNLSSIIGQALLNPFRKVSSVWIKTGGTGNDAVFEYIARVDENFIILEVADLQSIYVDEDSGEEFALVWTRNS